MAENVTSPISIPSNGGMNISSSLPISDIKKVPFIVEENKSNIGTAILQDKFTRTNLLYGDTNKPIFKVNRWQNYFENTSSSKVAGLYDLDSSGSDTSGFMASEGFYQTNLMSTETGFEQERGWINEPFQNYAFKGFNGNLKLYPGHEGSQQNNYVYTNTDDINLNINNDYLEFPDEHIVNGLAPQYTFTRGFSIDNDNNDRRLTNINFAQYQTTINNQDPVVFGYQLSIISETSPLFNGAVPDFLYKYSKMTDIKTRLVTYYQFFWSFFSLFELEIVRDELRESRVDYNSNFTDLDKWYNKVINQRIYQKSDLNELTNSNTGNIFNKTPYYLKKISGLDRLIEKNGFDGKGNFTDYGVDMITLTLNEDTNLSSGALIMLYKTLSWSKRSGKKMIPDNLLRFDLEITVSETRHYNRVIGNQTIADVPNKYTYFLYECQFVFDKMSHGDSIDMSNIEVLNSGVDISFTYKYSSVKMSTYKPGDIIEVGDGNNPNSMYYSENSIDNGKLNIYGGVYPIGASGNPSRISSGSHTNIYGKRNISGKIGDFGNISDGVAQPLNNTAEKLPSDMDISDFNLNRVRSTVSATIIQPTITSKMKDDIRNLYDNTKLDKISNFNSKIQPNDSKDRNQRVNSNVYSSFYNEADIYNTDPFGNYIRKNTIDNVTIKGTYGQDINILANSNTGNSIYAENIFLLPNIIPIIGLGFNSPNLNGYAYVNLGNDNVYYDKFGIGLNSRFSNDRFSIGSGASLGPNGLSLGGFLGLNG